MRDLQHMDVGSRNARLCATLEKMGLYVVPVFAADDPERIDYMHVSAALPQQATEYAAGTAVSFPMPSADVSVVVEAAEGSRGNVVDFPSERRAGPVLSPTDDPTVTVNSVGAIGDG